MIVHQKIDLPKTDHPKIDHPKTNLPKIDLLKIQGLNLKKKVTNIPNYQIKKMMKLGRVDF